MSIWYITKISYSHEQLIYLLTLKSNPMKKTYVKVHIISILANNRCFSDEIITRFSLCDYIINETLLFS